MFLEFGGFWSLKVSGVWRFLELGVFWSLEVCHLYWLGFEIHMISCLVVSVK